MKRRVCLVVDDLSGGGAERKVLTLARALIAQGHGAHVVILKDRRDYPAPDGVPVHAVYPRSAPNIDMFWRIRRSANDLAATIATIETRHGAFDLFLSNLDRANKILARLDLPSTYFMIRNSIEGEMADARRHGPLRGQRVAGAKRALCGRDVIAVSRGLAREVEQSKLVRARSVRTILNPFDLDTIRTLSSERDPSIPDGPFLLHVGRYAPQKRHDVLFEALRRVPGSIPLVVLGQPADRIRRAAERHGVLDRVVTPGFRVNPYPWMKAARLTVLSSDYEGFPNVLVESLACGTPAVSTRCPHGPDEILTGSLARWLVPCGDPAALGERIDEALTTEIDVSHAPILEQVDSARIARQFLELP